jgi:hypothetical protein
MNGERKKSRSVRVLPKISLQEKMFQVKLIKIKFLTDKVEISFYNLYSEFF